MASNRWMMSPCQFPNGKVLSGLSQEENGRGGCYLKIYFFIYGVQTYLRPLGICFGVSQWMKIGEGRGNLSALKLEKAVIFRSWWMSINKYKNQGSKLKRQHLKMEGSDMNWPDSSSDEGLNNCQLQVSGRRETGLR